MTGVLIKKGKPPERAEDTVLCKRDARALMFTAARFSVLNLESSLHAINR